MKSITKLAFAGVIFCSFHVFGSAKADIVSTSFNSFVQAQIENGGGFQTATDSSTANSANLSVSVQGTGQTENSITRSVLDHSWDGSSFSGALRLDSEKTANAKSGGQHLAEASFQFQFTLDSDYTFLLDGGYGFLDADGSGDVLSWSLIGNGVNLTGSPSGVGVPVESFSESGTLTAGTYTLQFTANLDESLNNSGLRQAGMNANLQLNPVAVPEAPAIVLFLFAACLMMVYYRNSSQRHSVLQNVSIPAVAMATKAR